ncbi:SDR family NAD(P)-dependent oxidoreductase [Rhizobium helianthi]|uniref:SDR family NAD(P)-dependent oxidoreductase n=1 Tax=Rhizobium helianthi TaxID=1132695 RepID=A0ABW4M304_9HYPH
MSGARHPDLAGRGVLITGGGSGIGAALTEAFAAQGAKVAFIDIAEDPSLALAERLSRTHGQTVHYIKADLRDVAAIRNAVEEAAAKLGQLGILINNAALDDRHDLLEMTEEYWDKNQAINVRHMAFAAQAAAPHLIADGQGAIVNMSSIAFLLNMGAMPAYETAKAGVLGLTKSLAGRLGPQGVRVNAILPGMIVTDRQLKLWLTDESMAAMRERQCLKRNLLPADLVGPCLFLASCASGAMTAQWITVDGGVL